MNGILLFTTIVVLVFGILQIILFFKLWGMTNNVSRMKYMMEDLMSKEINQEKENLPSYQGIKEKSLVVRLKDEKQMRVVSIKDGKYECSLLGGMQKGMYSRDEIELFDVFYKK